MRTSRNNRKNQKKTNIPKQKHFILIRGLIREAAHWGSFPMLLEQTYPGCKVTALDIPGAGIYFESASFLSIGKMVDQMRLEFLKNRKKNEQYFLIAISLGGMIAAHWMKEYRSDFKKMILINTSFSGYSSIFDRLKPSALFHLLRVPFLKGRRREARILSLVSNHKEVFIRTLDLWEKIQQLRPVSLANTFRQLFAAARFRIGNFKPVAPALILASAKDRMVNVKCSRIIASKWFCPVFEHPSAGHDLSADDPDWIIERMKSFI